MKSEVCVYETKSGFEVTIMMKNGKGQITEIKDLTGKKRDASNADMTKAKLIRKFKVM